MTAVVTPRPRVPGAVRVLRAVLRNGGLRRVMLAFLLFNAVEVGTWVAILLYAYDATGPASVGVVGLVQLVPSAVFAATAAVFADRYPRHRVLLAGYLAQAVTLASTAAAMLLGAPPVIVYLFAISAACAMTMTRPTQGALFPSLARTPEELTATNGLAGTVEGAGTLIGPLVAAGILVVAAPSAVFAAGTATCLVGALLVLRLPLPDGRSRALAGEADRRPEGDGGPVEDDPGSLARESAGRRLVRGLGALRAHPDAGLVVAVLAVRMLVVGALDVLFVLLALEVLETGEPGAGILTAALGLGTIAGGAATFALVGRRRLAPVLAGGAIVLGGSLLVLGGVGNAVAAAALITVAGMGGSVIDIAGRTMLQRVAQDEVLVRLLGALEGMDMAALAIGSILVPVIVLAAGIPAAMVVVGLLMPIAIGATWVHLRHIDAVAEVPVRELALLRANQILSLLPAPQLESVARRTRWLTAETGEVLIREGDRGDRYYVLASGSIRVTQGGRFLRDLSAPGDGVGEIALLRDVPRTATVTVTAPVVALALDRPDFLEAVTGHEQARTAGTRLAEAYVPEPTLE